MGMEFITAYSIINAESLDDAEKIAQDHYLPGRIQSSLGGS